MADETARWMAEVERRLRALETGQRATKTSLRGGQLLFKPKTEAAEYPFIQVGAGEGDDAGIAMFDDLGQQFFGVGSFNGDGVFVIYKGLVSLSNPSGAASAWSIMDGVTYGPLIPSAWVNDVGAGKDTLGRPTTTSASYVTLLRSYLPCLSGGIKGRFSVAPGSGNTMSWRIRAEVIGGTGPQTIVEQTGITVTTDVDSQWDIPDTLVTPNGTPIGHLLILTVDALRSAGSTAVALGAYTPVVNWVM